MKTIIKENKMDYDFEDLKRVAIAGIITGVLLGVLLSMAILTLTT